ncbi:MAG: 16S rRNA (uracil(1498)-N(3))-methyltransferase [Desulfosalsimonadaceae bacterium]
MRRFYIDPAEIRKPQPMITGADVRHMKKVLRHAPGDRVILIDGSGFEYPAVIETIDRDTARFSILETIWSDTASPLELVVAQGFLKEKKMDVIVRHLTELGLSRWIPVITERSVARPDKRRMAERMRRWEAIAIESLKQCGLSKLPAISPVMTLQELVADPEEFDGKIVFWEEETAPLDALYHQKPDKLLVLIGPEGGFTSDEIQLAQAAGFKSISLGPRILRAETAAISACTLVQYLYGDMKKSP